MRRLGLGLGLNGGNGNGAGAGAPPSRPASTTMLVMAHPDSSLVLSGSSVSEFKELIAGSVNFINEFGGTLWPRREAEFDGYNVANTGGDFITYRTPYTAAGLLNNYIASDGSHVAAAGAIALVFKADAVDDGRAWMGSSGNSFKCGMVNASGNKFRFRVRNTGGGIDTVDVACTTGSWHYALMRWTTTHAYLSIDGGAESSVALGASGGMSNMNSRFWMLGDPGAGGRADGQFMEASFFDPADVEDMKAFLEYTYPSLG